MDFTIKSNIDRSNSERRVPMRVLVLGMSRTGTNSLRDALKILGLNECYHQTTLIQNPEDGVMWLQALKAKYREEGPPFSRQQWDALLGHCQAVCDVPAIHFADELMDTYPDAKVVLTTRDVDAWHRSVMQTIQQRYHSRFVYFLTFIDRITWLWASVFYLGWDSMFHGDFEGCGREVFEEHYDHVRKRCGNTGRLLEYEVKQGWEPLCKFLQVPIPEQDFPAGNDRDDFHESCAMLDRSRAIAVARKVALPGLAICLTAFGAYRHLLRA